MTKAKAAANTPRALPAGAWQTLLPHALHLIDELARQEINNPFWTFGGGTVLMLRYNHRHSKDIDIFMPDPQYLAYLRTQLREVAETTGADYQEGARYLKLLRPEGEIDFVASTNLTEAPYESWSLLGRTVFVETGAEIAAKKLHHRGDTATARDIFDLSLVIEREPNALRSASQYLIRHRAVFIEQIQSRASVLRLQFEAIDVREYRPSYDEAAQRAIKFLEAL